jgi:hypothetical protein
LKQEEKMRRLTFSLICGFVFIYSGISYGVTIEDTTFKDVKGQQNTGWTIKTASAKYLFEAGQGRSGFGGLWSNDGTDWLQCYGGPGTPQNRGFPNSIDNFGHANRSSEATNTIRDNKREGDHLIIDAENKSLKFAYHFFEDHVAVEVLKATVGYHFLIELVAGGNVQARYWTGKGEVGVMTSHLEFTPEWIYISDKDDKSKYRLLMVKTPEDSVDNECWLQGTAMSGFSWGRQGPDKKYAGGFLNGVDNKISIAMIPSTMPFEEVKKMADALSANHLQPIAGGATTTSDAGTASVDATTGTTLDTTSGTSSGGSTGTSTGGTTSTSSGGTTSTSSGGTTSTSSGGTTSTSSGGTTSTSSGGTTSTSSGGTTTTSSGGKTTAASGGSTTTSGTGGSKTNPTTSQKSDSSGGCSYGHGNGSQGILIFLALGAALLWFNNRRR